jgi:hypothetical protein
VSGGNHGDLVVDIVLVACCHKQYASAGGQLSQVELLLLLVCGGCQLCLVAALLRLLVAVHVMHCGCTSFDKTPALLRTADTDSSSEDRTGHVAVAVLALPTCHVGVVAGVD